MRRTLGLILLVASVGVTASETAPEGIDARPRSGEKSWQMFCRSRAARTWTRPTSSTWYAAA